MRKEKQFLLDEIKEEVDKAPNFAITRYENLGPEIYWKLRTSLTKSSSRFEVVKKRIFLKVAQENGLSIQKEDLKGHIGIALFHGDPVEATKILFQFSKENENTLEVLSGFFEGKVYSAKDMEVLSTLPSEKEMRAQLLGTLEAPMTQLLGTMEALLASVIHCLQNKGQTS